MGPRCIPCSPTDQCSSAQKMTDLAWCPSVPRDGEHRGKVNQKKEDEAERHAPIETIGLSMDLLEGKEQWSIGRRSRRQNSCS